MTNIKQIIAEIDTLMPESTQGEWHYAAYGYVCSGKDAEIRPIGNLNPDQPNGEPNTIEGEANAKITVLLHNNWKAIKAHIERLERLDVKYPSDAVFKKLRELCKEDDPPFDEFMTFHGDKGNWAYLLGELQEAALKDDAND